MSDINNLAQRLVSQLALADLEPFFDGMTNGQKIAIRMGINMTLPKSWDSWVKEKLLNSENASYWKGIFG